MNLDDYQILADQTAVYPDRGTPRGFIYCALGLAGEAGEVANKAKKILRDDGGIITPERRAMLLKELGGVLWYVAQACTELGVDLSAVARINVNELASRAERGTVKGDGDNR